MPSAELSPSLAREGLRLGRFAPSALHVKAVFFDRRRVFLGSMNLDGRSEQYNTEVGAMIQSTALTAELLSVLDFEPVSSYPTTGYRSMSGRWSGQAESGSLASNLSSVIG
jgi:phosphatidylserine/phosphatidylglycerophosphate/cardiolipin synthase-like enzyme